MLFNSLVYFRNYNSLVQVHIDIYQSSIDINYSDRWLGILLQRRSTVNQIPDICKKMVRNISDKSILKPYVKRYMSDVIWVECLVSIDVYNDKFFISCCYYGYIDIVKTLVTKGVNIRFRNYYAFYASTLSRNVELMEYLYYLLPDEEERLKCVTALDDLPLKRACRDGNMAVIDWLTSIYRRGESEKRMLQIAIDSRRIDVIEFILSKKCSYQNASFQLNKIGDINIAKLLNRHGINVSHDSLTFNHACVYGKLETIKYIFNNHHDRNELIRSLSLQTPYSVLKLLVSIGADLSVDDYVLFERAYFGRNIKFMKYILDLLPNDEKRRECIQSRSSYSHGDLNEYWIRCYKLR